MLQSRHRFILEVRDGHGMLVHREEVADFLPCYEDLLFAAVCAGRLANNGALPLATVEPAWRDGREGKLAGVTVSLPPLTKTYGLEIFAARAWEVLVQKEVVTGEEQEAPKDLTWSILVRQQDGDGSRPRRNISLSRAPYPLERRALADLGVGTAPKGDRPPRLLCPRSVMDELRSETARSLDEERADVLTGHLVQEANGQTAIVVTGRIPAETDTAASKAHFSFSPLTFLAAQEALARRPAGETIVGWHHNHPPPCGAGCLQVVPPCTSRTPFFSLADRSVHRASFSAPYMVALVSGKETERRADEPEFRAYGWQDGVIRERDVSIYEEAL